jgi:PST family polysaccharide transporter
MRRLLAALAVSGSGSLITMVLGAITVKIIAVLGGPAGIALFSQLRQLVQWFVILATINGQVSLVRGIACREGAERYRYILVVAGVFLAGAIGVCILVIVHAPVLSQIVFGGTDESLVLAIQSSAIAVVLGTTATFVLGVINGYGRITTLAAIQVAASLATSIAAYPFARNGELSGYVAIVSTGFLVISVLGAWMLKEVRVTLPKTNQERDPTWSLVGEHVGYSSATLITGLVGAGSVLYLRSTYIHAGGLDTGGYFDAAWTLSMMYVMLILSSFGTYYFPTLSSKKTHVEINECVNQVFRVATLLATALVSFVVVAKHVLVGLLYSELFLPAIDIVRWMLIGDYVKISSWVFGMLLLAFAERRRFVATEMLFHGTLIISVTTMIGLTTEIVGMAFLVVNAMYLAYVWFHAKSKYGVTIRKDVVVVWVAGFVIVVGLSLLMWEPYSINMPLAFLTWLVALSLFSLGASSAAERRAIVSWVRNRIHSVG